MKAGHPVSWAAAPSDSARILWASNSATLGVRSLTTVFRWHLLGLKSASNGDNLSGKLSLASFAFVTTSDLHPNLIETVTLREAEFRFQELLLILTENQEFRSPDIEADEFNGTCIIRILNLKTFIERFYSGGGTTISALSLPSPSVNW
ncbi:MAG: hypothetical protein IPJ66_11365 [Bacteroidetes bacterium]|nr:hypothetical protein [Bacteroidota bacterium]